MRYQIEPLTDFTIFTTPAAKRRPNRFRATYTDTLELLNKEVEHLGGQEVVVEVACTPGDLRRDGMLRSHATVTHPGVRISFDSRHGPLTYATDAFAGRYYKDPPDWQINLRAIALSLTALRRVDDYGVVKRGEQYAGFKALPVGRAMPSSHMTRDEAISLLHDVAGLGGRVTDLSIPWRKARAAAHPDRRGGDRTLWDQVEQAAAVLGLSS